ncbi:MAG: O-methyltransferase [Saprospiraceae bacterium]|nr:O-methyltransferase [Saprospiraceae bacterium]
MDSNTQEKITSEDIYDYCKSMSSAVPDYLNGLEEKSKSTNQLKMISGPYLGLFLGMISKIINPQYILEIGTFTSYGTICLAQGLGQDGKIVTLEKNESLKGFADEFIESSGFKNHIIQYFGDAQEIIPQLDYTFDLVFIDAAKRQYIDYYEAVIGKVRSGGIIVADNVLWKGTILDKTRDKLADGLDAFNKHVSGDSRVENIILPIDDGLHLIRKK